MTTARTCTVCNARGELGRTATHVARTVDGMEWYECGKHEPTDNLSESARVALEPIGEWFARHGLPLP